MTSIPLARVYIRARFGFALIGGNLTAQSTGSHRGIGGGIQISETELQALLSFPARPGEFARRLSVTRCRSKHISRLYLSKDTLWLAC